MQTVREKIKKRKCKCHPLKNLMNYRAIFEARSENSIGSVFTFLCGEIKLAHKYLSLSLFLSHSSFTIFFLSNTLLYLSSFLSFSSPSLFSPSLLSPSLPSPSLSLPLKSSSLLSCSSPCELPSSGSAVGLSLGTSCTPAQIHSLQNTLAAPLLHVS